MSCVFLKEEEENLVKYSKFKKRKNSNYCLLEESLVQSLPQSTIEDYMAGLQNPYSPNKSKNNCGLLLPFTDILETKRLLVCTLFLSL